MQVSEYVGGAAAPDLPRADVVLRLARNPVGRDFVVGDVHGMFRHLRALLEAVEFDDASDRLISVGDLVDRGPDSRAALAWLEQPWFYVCRGNHEQFVLDSDDPEQHDVWVEHNGGEWWLELDPAEQTAFKAAFHLLPLAIEVETDSGLVGIVHADVPPMLSWDQFAALLESGNTDAMFYAMWSRNRITGSCTTLPIKGSVERVYCGHTPTRNTVLMDNVCFIDTGAVYCFEGYGDAKLTLVEIHPEPHREYAIGTNGPL